jgi:hypothetical protein
MKINQKVSGCGKEMKSTSKREVLQLCIHRVVGWLDAPPGIFGL